MTARERARLAIAAGLAEELREQQRIATERESAATKFYEADDRREALEAELATIDADRGAAVLELDALGLKIDKIATLLDITEGEVRRLRKAATPEASTAPTVAQPNGDSDV